MKGGPYTDKAPSATRAAALPLAARRHPLVAEVARRLADRGEVPAGSRIVVAVSGGADSLALLVAGVAIRNHEEPLIDPVAVHINHHLRAGAQDDAEFVTRVCEQLAVGLQVRDVHPAELPGNVQANARRLRYAALAGAARESGARFVAVAHHADDQLETMLMALGRGSGLAGLASMGWRRPLDDQITLVRPFLATPKTDCEDLCRAAGLDWRTDPANADATTARGRLRRDVAGVLEALWPQAARRATGLAEQIAAAGELIERELARLFGPPEKRTWSREALASLPAPLIAAGLRRAAVELAPDAADDLGQTHLEHAADAIRDAVRRRRTFQWPAKMTLEVTAHQVALKRELTR